MSVQLPVSDEFEGDGLRPSSVLPASECVVVSALAGLCPPAASGLCVVVSGGLPADVVIDVWQNVFVVTEEACSF